MAGGQVTIEPVDEKTIRKVERILIERFLKSLKVSYQEGIKFTELIENSR